MTDIRTPLPRLARWLLALAAGVAMRLGYGLEPVWWLALLAPVPLLIAAHHASAREAAAMALVAALIGPVLPWPYLAGLMPLPVVAGIAAAMAMQWVVVIVIACALQRRGHPLQVGHLRAQLRRPRRGDAADRATIGAVRQLQRAGDLLQRDAELLSAGMMGAGIA